MFVSVEHLSERLLGRDERHRYKEISQLLGTWISSPEELEKDEGVNDASCVTMMHKTTISK